jgi:hypothetical protein
MNKSKRSQQLVNTELCINQIPLCLSEVEMRLLLRQEVLERVWRGLLQLNPFKFSVVIFQV